MNKILFPQIFSLKSWCGLWYGKYSDVYFKKARGSFQHTGNKRSTEEAN
jgi:hypothetical protein